MVHIQNSQGGGLTQKILGRLWHHRKWRQMTTYCYGSSGCLSAMSGVYSFRENTVQWFETPGTLFQDQFCDPMGLSSIANSQRRGRDIFREVSLVQTSPSPEVLFSCLMFTTCPYFNLFVQAQCLCNCPLGCLWVSVEMYKDRRSVALRVETNWDSPVPSRTKRFVYP